jgi:hypothetical protein
MLKVRYNLLVRLIPSVQRKTMGALSRLLSLYPINTALAVCSHFGAPGGQLHKLIEPFYPKGGGPDRPAIGLARMLRMYVAQ